MPKVSSVPLHATFQHLPGLEHALGRVIQEFMQHMHHAGLSGPQIHALLYVFHSGECRIAEIGMLTGASPAAASQMVDRLVQQGLVERNEDPSNRRVKMLRLTDAGLTLIHEGVASNQALSGLMSALTAEERKTVHTAFGYLAKASEQIHPLHQKEVKQHA